MQAIVPITLNPVRQTAEAQPASSTPAAAGSDFFSLIKDMTMNYLTYVPGSGKAGPADIKKEKPLRTKEQEKADTVFDLIGRVEAFERSGK